MQCKHATLFNLALFLIFFLPLATTSLAQIEVEPTGVIFTPENLITNVFLGEGVEVTDIQYQPSPKITAFPFTKREITVS